MSERRFPRAAALAALVALALGGLAGCGSDEEKGAAPAAGATAPASTAPAPTAPAPAADAASAPGEDAATPEPALGAGERARAESALDFHNAALNALEEGYYALPDALYDNARSYLGTWHLPPRPSGAGSRETARARLRAPAGLFSEADAARLTSALAGMDKALDALLARYKELEDYVADRRIRDDGARGKALARKLGDEYEVFMGARKTWLEIVEARAAEAEAALLRGHPLRRQITAAAAIFGCYGRAAELLGAPAGEDDAPGGAAGAASGRDGAGAAPAAGATLEDAARITLAHIHAELEHSIAEAAKPPFDAAPDLERRYRAFLKEATAYAAALKRGLDEGFFAPQRRDLNEAAIRSRAAYNAFVRAANGARAR